ncbi:hypothetical protein [[Mycoplasma] collis]|uniref:hypothetical protein n=1 Tax=[Mycoplasma] collis TaxID=2127 RepID=UPI00051AD465|nr:hypothetical protein [[Mycoplasma] collis]
MKTLKVFETFSGIGAQHKALLNYKKKNPNFNFEIVATCDWDIYANIAYDSIFTNENLSNQEQSNKRERERESKKSIIFC